MPQRNPYLCLVVVLTLGLAVLGGIAAMTLVPIYGHEIPPPVAYITTTALGALSSFLVSVPRGQVGGGAGTAADEPAAKK